LTDTILSAAQATSIRLALYDPSAVSKPPSQLLHKLLRRPVESAQLRSLRIGQKSPIFEHFWCSRRNRRLKARLRLSSSWGRVAPGGVSAEIVDAR
jgi:hypothetical protein